MTPEQCSEARRLLGWTRYRLEGFSGISEYCIRTYEETGRVAPGRQGGDLERLTDLRRSLELAGIEFIDGGEPGVRLRKAER